MIKATKFHTIAQFQAYDKKPRAIIFGAGLYGEKVFNAMSAQLEIIAFADNDSQKHGQLKLNLPILSPDQCIPSKDESLLIIFVAVNNEDVRNLIIEQLENSGFQASDIYYFGDDRFFYPKEFYTNMENSRRLKCVQEIAINVMDLLGDVRSVLDVGCGNGLWLSIMNKEYAIHDLQGIDGEWAKEHQLDKNIFMAHDLTKPFELNRKFDLVSSIEVAEHLPEACAISFIDSLCKHGNIILFSAAIPEQAGSNHINCQYPSWWAKLFDANGYACVDVLRGRLSKNEDVFGFYKTNMMFYIKKDSDEMADFINRNMRTMWSTPLDIVSPNIFYDC